MSMRLRVAALAVVFALGLGTTGRAQLSNSGTWVATAADRIQVLPNVTYRTINGWSGRLDLYKPVRATGGTPTLIWFHGGGWTINSKEAEMLYVLPYLEIGWAVVNVEYRLADVALAPAAVEDCRCAVRWVVDNAQKYGVDPQRLVLSGISAGGHLALAAGMLNEEARLDPSCDLPAGWTPAAIINWFGPSDVADLISGTNSFDQAQAWLGARPDRLEIAKRISPLNYARRGIAPVITIHGDRDDVIPYAHSTQLHERLQGSGVANELVTIRGRGHGDFTHQEILRAYAAIRRFLRERGLMK